MPRRTSAADARTPLPGVRIVLVTMDHHLAGAAERARERVAALLPGAVLTVHAAAAWSQDPQALERCRSDIAGGDIVIATMLFMEEHFQPVLAALQARRDACDAMVCAMCAGEVMRLTRLGRFSMDGGLGGPIAFLKRLRGKPPADGSGEAHVKAGAGAQQMKMLRRLPKLLRFVPGTAQDLRAYFLTLLYWLAGSEDNVAAMVHALVDRYADGPRRAYRGLAKVAAPVEYADVGVYHPRMAPTISEHAGDLPAARQASGTVGLLLMRSYLLAGNTGHYDGVIEAIEARGLRVVPAFSSGLDARPAIERFFLRDGRPCVDAVVSLTGFSLVGGPAYNDAGAAERMLETLDVPYLAVTAVEFQTLAEWQASDRGLLPVEATMMVAIPELDGATGSMVFGGRPSAAARGASPHPPLRRPRALRSVSDDAPRGDDMAVHAERAAMLAARIARLVALRQRDRSQRRLAIVLFAFPPNAGAVGTAAHLAVFESLLNTLRALAGAGYAVEPPADVDALREALLGGNATRHGSVANVHARIPASHHVQQERWLAEIESQWGPAPGRQQSDGQTIHVLGARFGNVFVGLQPALGYEGDPMRLLFERGFAPTHAFSAFYRWLREDFAADAVLHFGTHGALEFMPGKQAGLSGDCWPDRLIGDLPNLYLYAANNPSEGTIAKRRSAATLVSYLTPPVAQAGLYRGLLDLKASVQRWRSLPPQAGDDERAALAALIQAEAAQLELAPPDPAWPDAETAVQRLQRDLDELETTLIPHGLHVVGDVPSRAQRIDLLGAVAQASHGIEAPPALLEAIVDGATLADDVGPVAPAVVEDLRRIDGLLAHDHELEGLLRALDGRYVPPAPGGDLLRNPGILPTGRNLHGFDPFRMPSTWAVRDGARQAERLLARHCADGHAFPESIALVLWGTDNLKSEGGPIAQALALMGARPRFDSYGRLAGAELLPLEVLGRPRVDVMVTLSGIFRDLLPLQVRMLAEAAFLAASADEPPERNFVRKHALAHQAAHGCDLETAALRVFGNAEGAYGANVNHLIDSSRWDGGDELAEAFTRRKGFAYGRSGRPRRDAALLDRVLSDVELAYQNLDSVELGVTTIDTYFDTLGGVSRAVQRAKSATQGATSAEAPVYIGDQTRGAAGDGAVRTLAEQVALETRTRALNPAWYEGLLAHGYEGVRQIEAHVTNTFAWSATTGQVQPWVYRELTQTFVLDPAMRDRLARLNPTASARVANRLLEASDRQFWTPDDATLEALRRAGEELEDRLEGIFIERAAA